MSINTRVQIRASRRATLPVSRDTGAADTTHRSYQRVMSGLKPLGPLHQQLDGWNLTLCWRHMSEEKTWPEARLELLAKKPRYTIYICDLTLRPFPSLLSTSLTKGHLPLLEKSFIINSLFLDDVFNHGFSRSPHRRLPKDSLRLGREVSP